MEGLRGKLLSASLRSINSASRPKVSQKSKKKVGFLFVFHFHFSFFSFFYFLQEKWELEEISRFFCFRDTQETVLSFSPSHPHASLLLYH